MHREGAKIGISYAGEALERRVKPLAEQIDCKWVEECDVTKDDHIDAIAEKAKKDFGQVDVVVHSIAFAGRDELSGPYYNTSREGFKNAMDISVFSFVALARAFRPVHAPGRLIALHDLLWFGEGGSALQCDGCCQGRTGIQHTLPGLRPRAGEDTGQRNLSRADPNTGRRGRGRLPRHVQAVRGRISLRENITIEDVGNAAVFLASDMSARITGEVLYVDSGFNAVGVQMPMDQGEGGA